MGNHKSGLASGSFYIQLIFALGLLSLGFLLSCVAVAQLSGQNASTGVGIFSGSSDVGEVLHAGTSQFDATRQSYTLSGSGENMWFASDAFQFAWKPVSGDISLVADVAFAEAGGNPHRKAVLMIRQTLEADSPYADVALHGEGLTSLQYRAEKGAATHEIQSDISAPSRLKIEKRGDYIYVFLAAKPADLLRPSGASIRLPMSGTYYVGIGVCAHDKNAITKAVFTNVALAPPAQSSAAPILYSTLETVTIASTDRRVVYTDASHFEAPNWSHDGAYFLINSEGRILKLPAEGGTSVPINTGAQNRCNSDHGISPDGHWLAISDSSQPDHQSSVYVVPIEGGTPRRITKDSPSYGHGWSPDGKTLAFVGQRNGGFDIYTIPFAGGEEKRLTTAKGLEDGPEYSPDGQYIYFNSERTGHMQIWRMHADGSAQEQITFGEQNDWFPHISPDGKLMVFVSYGHDVTGHPPNKDVQLRLMTLADRKITVLATLFGGQGTMNVPSWSPEGKKVAFVSYQLLPPEATEAK